MAPVNVNTIHTTASVRICTSAGTYFRACFTMHAFGTHRNYQEIKIILPVSQTLQAIKHYCDAN
jgi:hypothetical protein